MSLTIHDQPLPYVDILPERPADAVELVVIHCTELPDLAMAREYGEKVLHASGAGNSGHYYIDRDGAVYRYVPGTRVANHVRGHNPNSIGIELVNLGRYPHWWDSRHQQMNEPYTDAQVAALNTLLAQLRTEFPNLCQIAGHEDLDTALMPASDDPAIEIHRKLDPGPMFSWAAVVPACGLQRLGHAGDPETAEFLAGRVQALEDANALFSPQGKEERERWVAEEFLAYAHPGTPASEVKWVDGGEPWDVLCLGAKFQIKEVQEPSRRRHDEFKRALVNARKVTKPAELLEPWTQTTITPEETMPSILEVVSRYALKYAPAVALELDLLIYLNIDAIVVGSELKVPKFHEMQRWRSVSVVCNGCAFVLFASDRAPPYIRAVNGKVLRASS